MLLDASSTKKPSSVNWLVFELLRLDSEFRNNLERYVRRDYAEWQRPTPNHALRGRRVPSRASMP